MGPQRSSLCTGVFYTHSIQRGADNTAVTLTFTLHSALVSAQAGTERSVCVCVLGGGLSSLSRRVHYVFCKIPSTALLQEAFNIPQV